MMRSIPLIAVSLFVSGACAAPAPVTTPVTCRTETQACAAANVAAIQGAINAYGSTTGGIVQIADGAPINATIVVSNNVLIKGFGWGSSTAPSPSSYFKWLGPAGLPMFSFATYFGGGLENVRLIGNSGSPPSAAIQFSTGLNQSRNMQFASFDKIYIGEVFGLDTDAAPQFQDGILFTGTINEDTQRFGLVVIQPVLGVGVHDLNSNASAITFDNLAIKGSTNCIWTNAQINVHNLYCTSSGYNLVLGSPGVLDIESFQSEGSGGLAQLVGGVAPNTGNYLQQLHIANGAFSIGDYNLPRVVDVSDSRYWSIIFDNMQFEASACPFPTPVINLASGGAVYGTYRGTITSPGCGAAAGMSNYVSGTPAAPYNTYRFNYAVGGGGGPL